MLGEKCEWHLLETLRLNLPTKIRFALVQFFSSVFKSDYLFFLSPIQLFIAFEADGQENLYKNCPFAPRVIIIC